jgi:hypothetical protein
MSVSETAVPRPVITQVVPLQPTDFEGLNVGPEILVPQKALPFE